MMDKKSLKALKTIFFSFPFYERQRLSWMYNFLTRLEQLWLFGMRDFCLCCFLVFFPFASLGPYGKRWLFAHVASVSQIWTITHFHSEVDQLVFVRYRLVQCCCLSNHEHFMYDKIQTQVHGHEHTPQHHNCQRPFTDKAHAISFQILRDTWNTLFPKRKCNYAFKITSLPRCVQACIILV